MIKINEVFCWQGKLWRLVHLHNDIAYIFPIGGRNSVYKEVAHRELLAALEKGELLKREDPYAEIRLKDVQASKKGKQHYEMFKDLVENKSVLYNKSERAEYLKKIAKKEGISLTGAYVILGNWWQRGQCPASFIPDYGKSTGTRNGTKKIGRPSKTSSEVPGVNIAIRNAFERAYRKYLLNDQPLTIPKAYVQFLCDYQEEHKGIRKEQCPTLSQFRYHFMKNHAKGERRKKQTGAITYAKDVRPLTGSVYDIVQGCGQRYEIDSTQDNVTLVSQEDRTKIVGRPTLYVVSDVYSGLVCGVNVSLENAQLGSAMEALYMAISPKEPWLKKIGMDNQEDLWPVSGVPQEVVADNAELLSDRIEAFASTYGVCLGQTSPYRADQKGSVERAIGLIQSSIKDIITGVPDGITNKKAGHKERRLEATLTLPEYQSIVLLAVQEVNRRIRECTPEDYPVRRSPTPIALWQWSENVGKSRLMEVMEPELRRVLLPRVKVSTSKNGINANGIRYRCLKGADEGVFDRCKKEKSFNDPEIAFDPSDISTAWFYPDPSRQPEVVWDCILAPQSNSLKGMSYHEALEALNQIRQEKNLAEKAKYDFAAQIKKKQREIVQRSIEETSAARANQQEQSAREAIKSIARNRKQEKILQEKLNPKIKGNQAPRPEEKTQIRQEEKNIQSNFIELCPLGYPSDIKDIPP